jgi:hypothetical protein
VKVHGKGPAPTVPPRHPERRERAVEVRPGQVVVVLDISDARTLEVALRAKVDDYEHQGMKGRVLDAPRDAE